LISYRNAIEEYGLIRSTQAARVIFSPS